MDSLTHIALGACIGEAFFEKGFAKKAMVWGALAQSIPDIDFIASFWLNTSENLLAHRGFTHSILFALLIIPLFALIADKIHRPHNIQFKTWLLFFSTEVFLHLFIDGFNNYGIGWLEPFSHARFSFNTIYVADPFFSIWPAIAFVMLLILNRNSPKRKFWWRFGVFLPFIYLAYCSVNKIKIDNDVSEIFARQNIPHQKYFTTPAPLQNWLWYVVAGNDKGYYVGFRSLFDTKKQMNFQYFPRNDSLLKPLRDHRDLQNLLRFSQNFFTVEKSGDGLIFNDLRFGQIIGWKNPKEQFVFHYYLQHPEDNKLVVQRGRFAKWNGDVIKALLKRIKGN
ncbi:metal-dependent hydrolase [Segetibacter koreensis]|uniref:metal-dependent hydrolase n=1 Tax=Segetibacter koreensis TaxID=398037 RepID=UPI000360FFDB|nr:metal-dependent hydrolase [Segetibacter koreensis]